MSHAKGGVDVINLHRRAGAGVAGLLRRLVVRVVRLPFLDRERALRERAVIEQVARVIRRAGRAAERIGHLRAVAVLVVAEGQDTRVKDSRSLLLGQRRTTLKVLLCLTYCRNFLSRPIQSLGNPQ